MSELASEPSGRVPSTRWTIRRATVTAGLLVLLAGCGGAPVVAPAVPAPTPAPTAPADPAGTTPAGSPDAAACASHVSSAETVRGIAAALEKGPVLPAGVALFLLDARAKAAAPGISDPALVLAQAELVAAIDELDAQGSAGLPEGGNPAQDLVQLDAARVVSAVEAVEAACAAL